MQSPSPLSLSPFLDASVALQGFLFPQRFGQLRSGCMSLPLMKLSRHASQSYRVVEDNHFLCDHQSQTTTHA